MAVTALLLSPPSGITFSLNIIRPATTVKVSAGVGNYDIDFEWDTVTSFDSGNLITVSQNNVVAGTYSSVPTSDLDSGSTWFTRVVVDDLGDGSDTSATSTLDWYDPIDDDRFLYTGVMVQVSFDVSDEPTEGWGAISGSENADGAEIDFDRFLYTAASVGIGFEGTPPTEGWRQITGSDPGDGDELDFDRFLYAAVNVFLGLEGSGHASSEGSGDMDGGKTVLEALGGGQAASDASGRLTRPSDTGRFRLRKATDGSTLQGGNTLQGAEPVLDIDLAGAGHAAADGSADLSVVVQLAGGGDAAADASADLTFEVALAGSGHAASDGSGDLEEKTFLAGSGHAASDAAGPLNLDPAALAGGGDASSDAAAVLTVQVLISGGGDAASDGVGTLDISGQADLTGSGHASSEGTGDLVLDPVAVAGSGHAAADGTGDLEEKTFLSGSGHAAADGAAALEVSVFLSGSGHAASEGTSDLVLDPVSLVGSGHAAADGATTLSVEVQLAGGGDAAADGVGQLNLDPAALAGPGNASSEGSAILGTDLELSGSGHAASDGTGDMSFFSFMSGSGNAASEGLGEVNIVISLTVFITWPTMNFTALLTHTDVQPVGGVVRASPTVYQSLNGSSVAQSRSSKSQQLAQYQPRSVLHKRHIIAGPTLAGILTALPPPIDPFEGGGCE